MSSSINEVYEFFLKMNEKNGNALVIKLDSDIIKVESDVNEYCFFYDDKLVYVRADDELVYNSLEEFIKYVENANAENI